MKNTHCKEINASDQPLFTGNYKRDTAAAEFEKAAEVSKLLEKWIRKYWKRKKT